MGMRDHCAGWGLSEVLMAFGGSLKPLEQAITCVVTRMVCGATYMLDNARAIHLGRSIVKRAIDGGPVRQNPAAQERAWRLVWGYTAQVAAALTLVVSDPH
jgi:hypothetical protein